MPRRKKGKRKEQGSVQSPSIGYPNHSLPPANPVQANPNDSVASASPQPYPQEEPEKAQVLEEQELLGASPLADHASPVDCLPNANPVSPQISPEDTEASGIRPSIEACASASFASAISGSISTSTSTSTIASASTISAPTSASLSFEEHVTVHAAAETAKTTPQVALLSSLFAHRALLGPHALSLILWHCLPCWSRPCACAR